MKRIVLLLAAMLGISSAFAQTDTGIDYYYLGDYGKAEYYLQKGFDADPVNANFYLGETAFALGDTVKAAEYYNKALSLNPSFMLAKVGMAKLELKTNTKEAEKAFKELSKEYRKSAPLAVAIGRAYLDNGMTKEAEKQASEAIKFDDKYADAFVLRGDILVAEKAPVGDSAGEYEQAKYFAPEYQIPYMKLAQIYQLPNPVTATDNLQKAIAADPDNMIAYGMLGALYTARGFYPEAIAALKIYTASGGYSTDDMEHMARSYYFVEPDKVGMSEEAKFAEARKWVDEGLQKDPNHFILSRYRMYLDAQTGNPAGMEDAEHFFGLTPTTDVAFLPSDYTMYGTILVNAGRKQDAIAQYDKAISLTPDDLKAYDEVVVIWREKGDYNLAARYYEKMLEAKQRVDVARYTTERLVDINTLGNIYYQAGTRTKDATLIESIMTDDVRVKELMVSDASLLADSLKTNVEYFTKAFANFNLHKAEALFNEMVEMAPESYTGYYYLARTNNALYPGQEGVDNGKPKDFYTKTVSIIEGREEGQETTPIMQNALVEGLSYMNYYYFLKSDYDNAMLYGDKVLVIDPENRNATAIRNAIIEMQAAQ